MANVVDSFNRADSTSLGTADSGQAWSDFGGGAMRITSNQATTRVSSSNAGSDIDGGAANATYQVTLVNAGTIHVGGLVFRKSDNSNFWMLQIVDATHLYLIKRVAGVNTNNIAITSANVDGDVFKVVCSGDSITTYRNGVVIHSVTDSFNNTATRGGIMARPSAIYEDFSITAELGNTPPTANITAPADGSSVTVGANVTFTGTGTDSEDGAKTGAALVWTSSINGALGTGTSVSTSALSVGTHTITLTVTDSGGATGTDTITVTVNASGGSPVSDTFNRVNSGTLGTADSGQAWSNFGSGVIGINGNHAVVSTAAANGGSEIDAGYINAAYQVTGSNALTVGMGLIFRKTDANNFWVLQVVGGSTLKLRKFVAGVYTDFTATTAISDSDVYKVVCQGNSIITYQNDVQVHSITDAFNNTATKGGLSAAALGASYNNFSITGIVGGTPSASITAPANNSSFASGTAINFTGTGTDGAGGALTGTALAWTSSIDGALGTGTSLTKSTLSVGTHTITLTVTQGDAKTATATISVTITAPPDGQSPALPAVTPARVSISGLTYESTTTVTAANLQSTINAKAAINSAGHHLIIVTDGELITSTITLPTRVGTGYIVIRSQTLPCAEGIQAHPNMLTTQAEFRQTGGGLAPIIRTALSTQDVRKYILAGLNVTSTSTDTNMLVAFGSGSGDQNAVNLIPQDLIMDRCVVRGQFCRRTLALHSGTSVVVDSYLSAAYRGSDCQAIHGGNGSGPYLIEHNVLEGSGENVMMGGQSTTVPNNIPSDITIRLNSFPKPYSLWSGNRKSVKNLIEMKAARRVLIEGNFFENNWDDEQAGMSVLFKTQDQNLVSPWLQTVDVTFRYNFLRNLGGFINMTALPEGPGTGVPMERVSAHDNVAVNIGADTWTGDSRSIMFGGVSGGAYNFRYQHNTVATKPTASKVMMSWLGNSMVNAKMTDNIDCRAQSYGVKADGTGEGTASWNAHCSGDSELTRNVIGGSGTSAANYPPGNFLRSNQSGFGFVDDSVLTTLDTTHPDTVCASLTLDDTSPYKGVGLGGTDPGANMAAVRAFLAKTYVPGQRSDDFASFTGPGPNVLSGGVTLVATSLGMVTQPSSIASGATHTVQPQVEVRDQFGAQLSSDTSTVTATLITVSGSGTAIGTLTKAAVSGVASFTGLGVTSAGGGTFKWRFTDGALTSVDSQVFTVTGTATKLALQTPPSGIITGRTFQVQPVVLVQDANGVTFPSSASVTVAVTSGTAVLSGTLTVAAVNGVVNFTDLKLTGTGTVVLTFSSSGLTSVVTGTLTVNAVQPGNRKSLPKVLASKTSAKSGNTVDELWFS